MFDMFDMLCSSATVMDVRNETMLAVSTTINGCQVLAGIVGKFSKPLSILHYNSSYRGSLARS
jgi:hypothetical protein